MSLRWIVLVAALLAAVGALVWLGGAPGASESVVEGGEREDSITRAPDVKGPRLEGAGGSERPAAVVATPWTAPVQRAEPGGIVVRGRVIDVEGRGVSGGEVFARVPAAATTLVVVPRADGAFEFRTGDEQAGSWVLSYRKAHELSSTVLWSAPKAGSVTEGLEPVAVALDFPPP